MVNTLPQLGSKKQTQMTQQAVGQPALTEHRQYCTHFCHVQYARGKFGRKGHHITSTMGQDSQGQLLWNCIK